MFKFNGFKPNMEKIFKGKKVLELEEQRRVINDKSVAIAAAAHAEEDQEKKQRLINELDNLNDVIIDLTTEINTLLLARTMVAVGTTVVVTTVAYIGTIYYIESQLDEVQVGLNYDVEEDQVEELEDWKADEDQEELDV